MSRAFTRRQVLAAAAGAMLGFGACQKQETASDKPELVLRFAENQPEDYPTRRRLWPLETCWKSRPEAG